MSYMSPILLSNPSHANAKRLDFLPESVDEYLTENNGMTFLYESEDLNWLTEDQITICDGNNCIVRFLGDIVDDRFMDIVSSKIKFNI